MSFTYGDLLYCVAVVLVGMIVLDIGYHVAPLLALNLAARYKGKTIANWDELVRTFVSLLILVAVWAFLTDQVQSLADQFQSSINPSVLAVSYHVIFWIAIGSRAISGTLRSRTSSSMQAKRETDDSWNGIDQAARMARYLKRLNQLSVSGEIDGRTYERLCTEYEQRLRQAIESS